MDDSETAHLQDMLDHIRILEGFLQGVDKPEFFSDLEKQFAVARALGIIGEASARLSEKFRGNHTEIDWRALKSMRNLLVHEYAYVDAEEVWKACEFDVPDLKQKVAAILSSPQVP